jgi:hypothetical protein
MNTPNPRAAHSAEAEGRKLAKEISGNASSRAASGKDKRKVDGEANAQGRELAQAVAGDVEAQPSGDDSARRERIARAAYHKAEQRGFAPGGDVDDWVSAERELNEQ